MTTSTTHLLSFPQLPPTRREEVRETLHGVEISDPYRWLEDQNSPETRAWIAAQNAITHAYLNQWPGRPSLQKRLTELLKVDAQSMPTEAGGYYFYSRRAADQEQSILYRRKGLEGAEEMLVDPHPMSADKTTNVAFLDVSKDGQLLVYGIRQGGEDELEIHLLDLTTGQHLPDVMPRARYYGVSLTPDKHGFYYATTIEEGPRLRYHTLGTPVTEDRELFGEGYGPEKLAFAELSEDGRYLLITVYYGSAAPKTDLYFQNLAEKGAIQPLVNDVDARFGGSIGGDYVYLQTNWDAPNGRVLKVDLRNPARENWREIVPTAERPLSYFTLAGGKLFLNYLENVTSRCTICDTEGAPLGELPLPGLGSVGGPYGRWDSGEAFFAYTSFVTPSTTYRYDIATGAQQIWSRQNVPVDPEQFEVKQIFYPSKDGTQIPMFLIHRKGLELNGNRPTLMTGYGGFNASLTPSFSATAALWAEHDGVYVLVNLRGGGEFGEEWHKAGMLNKKQNVFDDFIAAAEWLIANRYTRPERLAISGGSNGGLLVGAALTQRPDLFGAVLCAVPLLDMVRYHQFLVAPYWIPEYGSSEDPEQFRTLYAYSPYHRVTTGKHYPATLFITGDSDTRVAPLHARKMAALLQAANASDKPILLHYDTKAGHSGGKPLNKQITDITDEQAFLFQQLGVE